MNALRILPYDGGIAKTRHFLESTSENQSDTFDRARVTFKSIYLSWLCHWLLPSLFDTNSSRGECRAAIERLFQHLASIFRGPNFLFAFSRTSQLNVCQFSIQSALNAMDAPIVTSVKCFRHPEYRPKLPNCSPVFNVQRGKVRMTFLWRSSPVISRNICNHISLSFGKSGQFGMLYQV